MRALWIAGVACALLSGCSTTGGGPAAPDAPAMPPMPEVVGKVPSQPGKCFFKDLSGKVFIDTCPN